MNRHLRHRPDGSVETYEPRRSADYPEDDFRNALKTVAQLAKMEIGMQVAAVDLDGWDHHEYQDWRFRTLAESLARGLYAFYEDMAGKHDRLTIAVMSEFGRRLKANESFGTDHGHGNVMLVLGGNTNGGRLYGQWPGLDTEHLDRGADLAVTTDYRVVLSEIVVRRLSNPNLGVVFPDLSEYKPLGIVTGDDGDVRL